MSSIPSTPVPQIATDATWASGPEAGQPTRIALPVSAQKQGIIAGQSYSAANLNYLLGGLSDWLGYVANVALNFQQVAWNFFGSTTINTGLYWIPEGTSGLGSWLLFGNTTSPAIQCGRIPCSTPGGAFCAGGADPGLLAWKFTASNADGSIVVAAGSSSSSDTQVYSSTDYGAATWTVQTVHAGANYFCNGLAFDKVHGVFIFIASATFGALPVIYTSPDGVTWTQRANPAGALSGATANFLFVGSNGEACIISSDNKYSVSVNGGATWSAFAACPITGVVKGAYGTARGWLLIGTTQVALATSLASPTFVVSSPFGSGRAVDIACDGVGRYLVVHKDGTLAPGNGVQYSDDGANWTFLRFDASHSSDYVPKSVKWNGVQWAVLGAPTGGGANTFALWLSLATR